MKIINIDFVEYGKIFTEHDATDFQILDRSNEDILNIAGRQCETFIDRCLKFPGHSPKSSFTNKVPNHSAAFLDFDDKHFLFVQIQSREEGEFARSIGNTPRINRAFNQFRFSLVNKTLADYCFLHGNPLFSALLYENHEQNNLGNHRNALKDYIRLETNYCLPLLSPLEINIRERINIPESNTPIRLLVNSIISNWMLEKDTLQLEIQLPDIEWKQRLELMEFAQILVWPLLGCFTFALDEITENNVNVKFFEKSLNEEDVLDSKQMAEKKYSTDYYLEITKLHNEFGNLFINEEFIGILRRCFATGIDIYESGKLAALITDERYEVSEDWIRSSQKILDSDAMVSLLKKSGLYKEYLFNIQKHYFPESTNLLEYIPETHREFGQFLLHENFARRFKSNYSYWSNRATVLQTAAITAVEENEDYHPSEQAAELIYAAPNSLKIILFVFNEGLLDQFIDRLLSSDYSSKTKEFTEDLLLLFEEIKELIRNGKLDENKFFNVFEKCFSKLSVLHSGIVAILLSSRGYRITRNGICWSQETLRSSTDVDSLFYLQLYDEFIHGIQDFYIPDIRDLLPEIDQIHIEFGESLLDNEFTSSLRDCFNAGLPLVNSVIISAVLTINYDIWKEKNKFDYMLDQKFFAFFHTFHSLYRVRLSVAHSVIVTLIIKKEITRLSYDQQKLLKEILASSKEIGILNEEIKISDFLEHLLQLELPEEIIKIVNEKISLLSKSEPKPETIPLPDQAPNPYHKPEIPPTPVHAPNPYHKPEIPPRPFFAPNPYPKPADNAPTPVPHAAPPPKIGLKLGLFLMVTLIIVIPIVYFLFVYILWSMTSQTVVLPFLTGTVNLLQGIIVADLFMLIPFLGMMITGYRSRISQAFSEIILFIIVLSIVSYFMFRLKGNGTWMIYSIAIASVLDIGGHIIDQIRENRLNRIKTEMRIKRENLSRRKSNLKQIKILNDEIAHYDNMLDYVHQFDRVFNFERILYAALPLGILVGVCLAIHYQSSTYGYLIYSIQSVSFSAAIILIVFIYRSFTKMLSPVYVKKRIFRDKLIFSSEELDKEKDAKEREIGIGKTTTELRELFLFDSIHNVILLSVFLYVFLASIYVFLPWRVIVFAVLLMLTIFSQFPFIIGQYLLRQYILNGYGGYARGLMEGELKKEEYAPLLRRPEFILALTTLGTGGLLFVLAGNFIKGLFK